MSRLKVCAAGGFLAVAMVAAQAETVVLKQSFNDFDVEASGIIGVATEEGGAWQELRKTDTAPQVSDQEYFSAEGESSGKSIKVTRDGSGTMDFWLIGSWGTTLETGKARVSFRILRDSGDSGMSVHFGNAEKALGVNTIGVAIGNRLGGETLKVMNAEGAWQDAGTNAAVGTWTQITFDIDLSALTYTVLLDGAPAAENVPFTMSGPLFRISFLPAVPDGNIIYVDDVEVVALD